MIGIDPEIQKIWIKDYPLFRRILFLRTSSGFKLESICTKNGRNRTTCCRVISLNVSRSQVGKYNNFKQIGY